jgi:ABC-2 type transport system ATP-binding protein
MIRVDSLVKRYGDLTAVDRLTFEVAPGEVLGLVGHNGAGKTSTLRCVAGIMHPTEGSVHVAGHNVRLDPLPAKRALAFVPDDPQFFDYLTVEEHLHFTARLYNTLDVEERAPLLLDRMELHDKRANLPDQLSRGMRQKLAIACALLHRPRAMLFDEPLSGLDPGARRRMKDTILAEARAGAAVILSSHQLQLVEELCDRILVMRGGRAVALGSMDQIMADRPELSGQGLESVFLALTGEPDTTPDHGTAEPNGGATRNDDAETPLDG